MIIKKILLAASVLMFANANAEFVPGATITATGCNVANVCFIQVDSALSSCTNAAQINFDGSTATGKSWYAAALTAKASGSTVTLGTLDVCDGDFDTLNFLTVK